MRFSFYHLIVVLLLLSTRNGFSEGTKEFWPDPSQETRVLIAKGTNGGQQRDPFALYDGAADYRLYFHIQDPLVEKVYFGIGERNGASVNSNGWRIHEPDGTVVYQGSVPAAGQGFIISYDQAIHGPNALDPLGYDALSVSLPAGAPGGDYFMTFDVGNNTSRTFKFLDITVVNSTTNKAIDGRVFSKNWQFSNPSSGFPSTYAVFKGLMFVYSADKIVTKVNPNGMEGRDFSFSCNESGCFPIAPPYNAQQARQSQPGPVPHNYPQFKIFLNNPDPDVYPDGTIGQLVDGSVSTESFCNTGRVNFNFETSPVDAIGTVEIILTLSALTPPMVDRVLITNNVPGGIYSVVWDGKDGAGNQVPNGSVFLFTLRYTNGLTHMPLWDVENNANGFIVTLVRPILVPPLADPAFYWDDNLVGGSQVMTPPGCTVPPSTSCHAWDNQWGDQKSINTWWYLVSNSTANVSLTYKISPSTLVPFNPPTQVCPGSTNIFTVNPDINSSSYHWVWTGGTQNTTAPTISITFPPTATPGTDTVYVNGINAECGNGPVTKIPFTIRTIPALLPPFTQSTCSGVVFSIPLTSSQPGTTYTWTVTGADCSSNITSCPVGNFSGTLLTGNLSVNDLSPGTVTYHVTPAAGCTGLPGNIVVTVAPKPTISSPSTPGESICNGGTVSIELQSLAFPTAVINYSVLPGGCNNILNCPSAGTGGPITATLNLLNPAIPGSVVFTIIPSIGGCNGNQVQYTVTVLPLPVVQLANFAPVCLNTAPFALTGGTPSGGTYTLGSVPITIFYPATVGAGTFSITYTYMDGNSCTNSDHKNIVVQPLVTPSLAGNTSVCLGDATLFTTDPNMTNYQWSVTPDGVIQPGANSWEKYITWSTTSPPLKTITVLYTNPVSTCVTIPATISLSVNPKPITKLQSCFDKVTTLNAKPILLKGGTPLGLNGHFYIDQNSGPAVTYFNPLAAGTGAHWVYYVYTNSDGCHDVDSVQINVLSPAGFSCGSNLTDPRDGESYQTIQFGTQCWMQENLRYPGQADPTSLATHQTDNCIFERYCISGDAACALYGSFYQWDELMQYNSDLVITRQGFCPPGWHVPSSPEWQALIEYYQGNGIAGGSLKDLNSALGFQSILNGIFYLNTSWAFIAPQALKATMFWTSTLDAATSNKPIVRGLNTLNPSVSLYESSRANAFPVRCMKD